MTKRERIKACISVGHHLLKGGMALIFGVWRILRLPAPRVSIFGGSKARPEHLYAEKAHFIAELLAEQSVSVVTGGGPGVMQAANCGVVHAKGWKEYTIGVGISGVPGERGVNFCAPYHIIVDYFWVRKWLLIDYAQAFVVFPGGFGTLDELMELLTLIQTGKRERSCIVLFGSVYWKTLLFWFDAAIKEELLSPDYRSLFVVTDDVNEAVSCVLGHCNKLKKRAKE